ncbi:MAG TPA: Ig-like domain-containing protein [bacterium]|nr:Ig-like domain-containing protein [bacterium]
MATSIMRVPPLTVSQGLWPAFYVQSTTPTNGAVGYGQPYLTAVFNRAIDADTINKSTFKLKCGEKIITNANVQALSPDSSDNKAAIFWANELLAKNVQCLATLTTGIKSSSGDSLTKDYTWGFKTEARNECILNECSQFYGGLLVLDQAPNAQKHNFVMEGGGMVTCLAVPKDVYGDEIFPHLMGCMPLASDPVWLQVMKNWDWVEGVQGCAVPVGKEAWGQEDFWWSDDPAYIASANEFASLKGDDAFDTENVVLFCYSPRIKEWRDACGNNTCGNSKMMMKSGLPRLFR